MSRRTSDQRITLPDVGTKDAYLVIESKRAPEQTIGVKLLKPLAIEDIGFAPGDIFDVSGIDQYNLEPTSLQNLIQRDPLNAS